MLSRFSILLTEILFSVFRVFMLAHFSCFFEGASAINSFFFEREMSGVEMPNSEFSENLCFAIVGAKELSMNSLDYIKR